MEQEPVEHFHPTGGRLAAVLALLVVGVVVVLGVADPGSVPRPLIAGAVLVGVLTWTSMLRPALWVTRDHLVMRNMLETVHLPLAAIEQLAVRQVLAVRVGDKRYVSSVVGRSWRKAVRGGRPGLSTRGATAATGAGELAYPDYVEQRLLQLTEDARAAAGVRPLPPDQLALAAGVRREPAWLPVALVVAAAVALGVTLVV